jgi:hypothetical protein
VPDDIEPIIYAAQDPHDPVWESEFPTLQNDPGVNSATERETVEEIRNAHGAIELLTHIRELVEDVIGVPDELPNRSALPNLVPIKVMDTGSDKFRCETKVVPVVGTGVNPVRLGSNTETRRRITIINYGPNLVYISATTPGGAVQPNQVRVPISGAAFWAPIVIETKDEVWATAVTAPCTVETIEEFDNC